MEGRYRITSTDRCRKHLNPGRMARGKKFWARGTVTLKGLLTNKKRLDAKRVTIR